MKYSQREINLHTHSFYCGHGCGEISEYVKVAEQSGIIKVLGFSEHCPVPGDCMPDRMKICMFQNYLSDIENAASESNLIIMKGVECDWRDDFRDYYASLTSVTDYMIGSVHFLTDRETGLLKYVGRFENFEPYIEEYTESYLKMLKSGLFLYGCHPDLFMYKLDWNSHTKAASEKIISVAKQYDIPLEVNGQGARKHVTDKNGHDRMPYPVPEFWLMAKDAGVRICCSSDAHNPEDVYEKKCFDFGEKLGLSYIDWDF